MAGLVFNYLSARTITGKLLNFIIMAEVHYMTQDGLDKLKKDLADALAQRPVISAAIAEAREKGDLSENAEYDAARDVRLKLTSHMESSLLPHLLQKLFSDIPRERS